jgi:hypothetical protein
MTQWRRIEALTVQPGPLIWRTSRTAIIPIALDQLAPAIAATTIQPTTTAELYDPT